MRILIAHDRGGVANEIVELVRNMADVSPSVDLVSDVSSARRVMREKLYDLLVLDLTLPNIQGRDVATYQPVDTLLQELLVLDDMYAPGDIIGLTMDADALTRIQSRVGPHVMAIIGETPSGVWKDQLRDKIKYVARASNVRQFSIASQFDVDAVVITALDKELAPYREFFDLSEYRRFKGAYTFTFTDRIGSLRRGVAFAVGKSGEARAASYTQSLVSIFRPKLCIMTGICGGVEGKTSLGDVIIAESAIDWDYGKWDEPRDEYGKLVTGPAVFRPRPDPASIADSRAHRVARRLVLSDDLARPEFLRQLSHQSEGLIAKPSWHLAPYASGSSVIDSKEVTARVRSLNDAIRGVDMECFGFYHAALKTHVVRPEAICFKSVSDFANGSKGDKYHEGCSFLSAAVAQRWISHWWDFD